MRNSELILTAVFLWNIHKIRAGVLCSCTKFRIIFLIFNGFSLKKASFQPLSERRYRSGRKEVFHIQDNNKRSRSSAFCCYYAVLGSTAEAAVRAGFPKETALEDGIRCLRSRKCREMIENIRSLLSDSSGVAAGLNRLAFGSCSDAVYLAFADELPPPEVISSLDLYNVSEIKRVKGGGVEIKLFDRIKALEKLSELESAYSERDKAEGLINALISPEGDEAVDDT